MMILEQPPHLSDQFVEAEIQECWKAEKEECRKAELQECWKAMICGCGREEMRKREEESNFVRTLKPKGSQS
ncbi:hypothetical protein CDL15_Pgr024138 [Punica granatum]|uniref:Uncharacterized protein n=1 Tax=Punica granatum TaxID=22663 RepID=A0A218XX36_PUNGR|nr:hypothetical protein CDL15_Pgr024138 [Punica granatum]